VPEAAEAARCPDCGTQIVTEPGIPGLCPQCLLSLALRESPAASPGDGVGAGDRRPLSPDRGHPRPPRRRPRPRRALPDPRAPRPRRDGRGLPGLRPQAASRRRAQGRPPREGRVRAGPGAAAPRGPLGPRGRLPQRLPHLRPRRRGRPGARVDGVHRRGHPGRDAEAARPAAPVGGPGDRGAVSLRARGDPPGRPRPPGLQARERHAHPGGAGRGDGLRAGQGGGLRACRDDLGHAGLHGPGADAGRAARRAGRRLRGGGGPRGDAVRGGQRGTGRGGARLRGTG
jgi:hypothetical protein